MLLHVEDQHYSLVENVWKHTLSAAMLDSAMCFDLNLLYSDYYIKVDLINVNFPDVSHP